MHSQNQAKLKDEKMWRLALKCQDILCWIENIHSLEVQTCNEPPLTILRSNIFLLINSEYLGPYQNGMKTMITLVHNVSGTDQLDQINFDRINNGFLSYLLQTPAHLWQGSIDRYLCLGRRLPVYFNGVQWEPLHKVRSSRVDSEHTEPNHSIYSQITSHHSWEDAILLEKLFPSYKLTWHQ